ncbi:nucleoside deaminase [Halopseudomonas sp.]|uniref:nucleoside deaminase n=1 Tax=Halopseudomonas sp. TaxID=2901191 RepID=UPI00311EC29A
MHSHISDDLLYAHADSVIDLAISNVSAGGLPFSAIIVNQSGNIIGKGVNQVASQLDCTAHAEIQAIRDASQNEKTASLKGTTLIASGEPCALCYMAIRVAGIMKVLFISDRHDAEKHSFDYLWTYKYLKNELFSDVKATQLQHDRKLLPFQIAET